VKKSKKIQSPCVSVSLYREKTLDAQPVPGALKKKWGVIGNCIAVVSHTRKSGSQGTMRPKIASLDPDPPKKKP